MARLGELLVAAGVLTTEQIDYALRAQVMWGARLGTNLIELGFLDLDALSSALGQQHNLPAALARHFDKVDRELQQLLSPDVAHKLATVPLLRVGPLRQVVIASTSPLSPKALAIIADELCVEPNLLIPSVAAELRIRYQLERVYNIGRPSRFMRSPGENRQSFHEIVIDDFHAESDPDFQLEATMERAPTSRFMAERDPIDDLSIDIDLGYSGADESQGLDDDDILEPTIERGPQAAAEMLANLDDLPPSEPVDDLAVPDEITTETSSGKERRRYVRTIADGPPEREAVPIEMVSPATTGSGPSAASLGRIAIRKLATAAEKAKAAKAAKGDKDVNSGNTLGEATRAIRRATDRDRVARQVIDALFRFMPSCHSASMLVVRGGIATSWKGFCRSGAPEAEVSVPLDQPGLVARASHRNMTARARMTDLGPLDQRLVASLSAEGDLLVVPVSIASQVMCVIVMVTEPEAQPGTAESIAAAAGAAFARLMRDASR